MMHDARQQPDKIGFWLKEKCLKTLCCSRGHVDHVPDQTLNFLNLIGLFPYCCHAKIRIKTTSHPPRRAE